MAEPHKKRRDRFVKIGQRVDTWTTCPAFGKHSYRTRRTAKQAASRMAGRDAPLTAYLCDPERGGSGWWHLTSADQQHRVRYRAGHR
jgi:hypothetical protein